MPPSFSMPAHRPCPTTEGTQSDFSLLGWQDGGMGRRLVGTRKWKGRKEEHPRPEPAVAQGQGGGELCGEGTCSVLGRLIQGGQFSPGQTS